MREILIKDNIMNEIFRTNNTKTYLTPVIDVT